MSSLSSSRWFCPVLALSLTGALAACAEAQEPSVAEQELVSEITIDGLGVFPESIASDAAGNIYVGSNPGVIYRAQAGSDIAEPWLQPDDENSPMSAFGVLADDARGLLWVCFNPSMGTEDGAPAIKAFDLASGALEASYPLATGEGPAMCNDITIAPDGAVFASEMLGGQIMKLAPGGEAFEVWAVDPEFATLDGISFAADGTLYANAIQRNTLLRIHREEDGSFARAEQVQTSRDIVTPDGLRPLPDGRMLQTEGEAGLVTVITFDADGSAIVTPIADGVDYASSVTPVGGRAYYPEGKLRFLFGPDAGKDPGAFVIRSVAIPEVQ
ncbi:SMP-30/gluconolactonase/LRE family protein [Aurantiacibacter flavus]|uniref:SMP-30/Gluconolactonase/LRE-like region domain-containing protein n=1 Tax=Aurantiacibacter flavus TaxID=3145232 RepID=A0ABV0CSG1_9SPHN